MSQVVSNVGAHPDNDTTRMKYGGGITTLFLFTLMFVGMLYAYEDFTSGRIEWHLFSKNFPIIPSQIIVAVWWVGALISVGGIILSIMPSVSVIIDNEKIVAQSIYTRKFRTIYYKDILDAVYNSNYINIVDKHNNKIYLGKILMNSAEYKAVKAKLQSSAGITA